MKPRFHEAPTLIFQNKHSRPSEASTSDFYPLCKIVNNPSKVVKRITDHQVDSKYYQGDKGYTLSIKNCTKVRLDAYWVNYQGGMRLLGRHSVPPAPENFS